MTEFRGLCIGGPMDGEILTNYAPYYSCHTLGKISVFGDQDIPVKDGCSYTVGYQHTVGLRGDYSIDFWLSDGVTVVDAFHRVFDIYADRKECKE